MAHANTFGDQMALVIELQQYDRTCQDYVYVFVKWEYESTMWKLKYYLRREYKVNENEILSCCDIDHQIQTVNANT